MAPADDPEEEPKANPAAQKRPTAKLVRLDLRMLPEVQPDSLSSADAIRIVRMLAAKTENIVVIPYGKRKTRMRRIGRRQIELCVQKGTLTEGPFVNPHGHWQLNVQRRAAGEEITCVVAIDWPARVLVINAF
jgi:hypothetical protein